MIVCKVLHLFALGLWFGSVTFFSFFTALPVIEQMKALAVSKQDWLPGLDTEREGTRLAGIALSAVFDRYFYVQVACGGVALLTSFCWLNASGARHKLRSAVIALALVLVLTNTFFMHPKISQLRIDRYSSSSELAQTAEADFGKWHTYSLITDMVGLLLVGVALGMAAGLPSTIRRDASSAGGSP